MCVLLGCVRDAKLTPALQNLWSSVVIVAVGLYILYSQIGAVFIATLLAIAFNLALTPIASSCGTNITELQGNWSAKTDARVNLLESAVRDAKGVKFAAYEDAIEKKLLAARDEEITCAKGYLKRLLIVIASSNFNVEIMSLATFTALGIVDLLSGSRRFTLNTVFTSLTTIAILEVPLMQMGQQYASIISAYASIKRIEVFLREKERPSAAGTNMRPESAASLSSTRDHKTRPSVDSNTSIEVESAAAATFKEATIGWAGKPVLTNVALTIPRGRLTMVCGRIGSGKSTLLLGLLGEADVLSGESQLPMLARPVAFCAQDNWMMEGASIRDNILFDGAWDAERYQTALRACCLDVDVLQLAQRDRTLAKALSGGQRQRVSLARALYADAEAYVLDDVTSALDAETAAALWRNLMGPQGLLRGKTIVMASK
jgi:ABC-type multidrug transport system fused ATPase/permease subunit